MKHNFCVINDRGTWTAKFRAPDGRQVTRTTGVKVPKSGSEREVEKTKYEAMRKAKAIVDRYIKDFICSSDDRVDRSEVSLGKFIDKYLKLHKCEIAGTTYDGYCHFVNKHIKPYFGNMKLKDIKRSDLDRYKSDKLIGDEKHKPLSEKTVGEHLTFLNTVFEYARSDDIIEKNPAEFVKKPQKKKFEPHPYTPEELQTLIGCIQGTDMELPIMLAVLFGLRRSEAIGLRWSHIDFDNKILKVCETVTRQKNAEGKWVDTVSTDMKTDASKSEYKLTDEVISYLKAKYEEQRDMPRETDAYMDYVCVNCVGQRLKLDYVTHKYSDLLKENGLSHNRFHDLRHSCISLLVNCQISMKDAQVYARHADFNMTANTYSHALNSSTQTSLDAIVNALNFTGIKGSTDAAEENAASNKKHGITKQPAGFCGMDNIYAALVDMNGMF